MKRWWRTGLSGPQVEQLQRDARILLERYGPKAREIALQRAAAYRHRHFREAAQLSRVAACIDELSKQSVSDVAALSTWTPMPPMLVARADEVIE